ncbi:predicted protein [Postia placenta Mad-698-R]|nr:predicted protein [Postia placenta Mad-698-R]
MSLVDHDVQRIMAHSALQYPTIVASLPGKDRAFFALPEWADVSIAFEVMQHNDDDPIGKDAVEHELTLTRIAHHAQNIFVAQNRLFVFVVGIFGSSARIFRFDHAAAVVSEAFDYTERPEILREFLWRFVYPLSTTSSVAGADPSIQIPEEVDIYRAQKLLDKSGKPPLSQAEQKVCRWITVRDTNGDLLRFFAFRLLYTNPDMFSRASCVWEAIKDGEKTGRTYVIKDSWRQLCFPAETDFYNVLHEGVNSVRHGSRSVDAYNHADTDPCLLGLAQDYIGVDYGEKGFAKYPNTSRKSCADFFNWKTFLKRRGLEVSRESWEQYARQRYVANNGPGTRRDEPGDHPLGERRPIERWTRLRTGTLYFIAVEVMEGISLHEARHDLESFYWLLFWLMLRHTKHDHHYGQKTSDLYFKAPSDSALAEYKSVWLIQNMPILVPGNRPLSKLLVDLGDLCRRNCLLVKDPIEPLTHEAMLARFNEALASPDWPEEDPAIPLKPEPQPSNSSNSDLSDTHESHSIRRTASTQQPHSTHWFEDRLIRSADSPVREAVQKESDYPNNASSVRCRSEPSICHRAWIRYKHTRDLLTTGQKVAFQSRSSSKRSREDDDDDDDYEPAKRPRSERADDVRTRPRSIIHNALRILPSLPALLLRSALRTALDYTPFGSRRT